MYHLLTTGCTDAIGEPGGLYGDHHVGEEQYLDPVWSLVRQSRVPPPFMGCLFHRFCLVPLQYHLRHVPVPATQKSLGLRSPWLMQPPTDRVLHQRCAKHGYRYLHAADAHRPRLETARLLFLSP